MKIRVQSELIDFLDSRKASRKQELTSLGQAISFYKGNSSPKWLKRAAIVVAYAHWEGFIKEAASAYVHLVAHKTTKLSSLSPSFQAVACKQEFQRITGATKRIQPHLELVKRLTEKIDEAVSINANDVVDTESNLDSKVFENICLITGIEYSKYWAQYGPYINDLVSDRCAAAHGELSGLEDKHLIQYINFVIISIDQFATDIVNAEALGKYLNSSRQD